MGDLIGDLENEGCVSVADEAPVFLLIRLQALGSGPVSASARFRDVGVGALWGREGLRSSTCSARHVDE